MEDVHYNPKACIRLNNKYTDWFDTPVGVKQGDTLSPTLFSIFINNLAIEVNNKRCGITIDGKIISILLYADDIVIIAETDENLQIMLNVVHSWCDKWQLQVNEAKSKIVHFRPKQAKLSTLNFKNWS